MLSAFIISEWIFLLHTNCTSGINNSIPINGLSAYVVAVLVSDLTAFLTEQWYWWHWKCKYTNCEKNKKKNSASCNITVCTALHNAENGGFSLHCWRVWKEGQLLPVTLLGFIYSSRITCYGNKNKLILAITSFTEESVAASEIKVLLLNESQGSKSIPSWHWGEDWQNVEGTGGCGPGCIQVVPQNTRWIYSDCYRRTWYYSNNLYQQTQGQGKAGHRISLQGWIKYLHKYLSRQQGALTGWGEATGRRITWHGVVEGWDASFFLCSLSLNSCPGCQTSSVGAKLKTPTCLLCQERGTLEHKLSSCLKNVATIAGAMIGWPRWLLIPSTREKTCRPNSRGIQLSYRLYLFMHTRATALGATCWRGQA